MKKTSLFARTLSAALLFGTGFLCAWLVVASSSEAAAQKPSRSSRIRPADRADNFSAEALKKSVRQRLRDNPSSVAAGEFYVAAWAMDDAERAALFTRLQTMPPFAGKSTLVEKLRTAWADRSPEAMVAFSEKLPYGTTSREMQEMGVRAWAKRDPQALAQWIAKYQEDGDYIRPGYQCALIQEWGRIDPEAAVGYVRSLPKDTIVGQQGMMILMNALARTGNIETAVNLMENMDGEKDRNWLLRSLAESLSEFDVTEAARWASSLPEDDREHVLKHVLKEWSSREPEAAMPWILQLSADDPVRENMMRDAVWNWARANAQDAAAWLAQQPVSPEKDNALTGFSYSLAPFSPMTAMEWAGQVADPEKQKTTQLFVMRLWKIYDRDGALAYLSGATPFTPEEIGEILKSDGD